MSSIADILPNGKYTLIGLELATTGILLSDEMFQLAAYTPTSCFEQYVLPLQNIGPNARRRCQVRVITQGCERRLECTQCYGFKNTMSEYGALNKFLDWIESVRSADSDSQGVIFVSNEVTTLIPHLIIGGMRRYDLLERFLQTAKSFVNCHEFIDRHCNNVHILSLCDLALQFFHIRFSMTDCQMIRESGRESAPFARSPGRYAELTFHMVLYLANREKRSFPTANVYDRLLSCTQADLMSMMQTVKQLAGPIRVDVNRVIAEITNKERQSSLQPIFSQYYKTAPYQRNCAIKFRSTLAANGHDLNSLEAVWTARGKGGLVVIIGQLVYLNLKEKTLLTELLDSFFDPARTMLNATTKRSRATSGNIRTNK